jgi:PAS domain S-box-containing protein
VEKLHGFPVDEILSHDASFVIPPRYMGLLTEDLPVRIAAFQAGDEGLRVKTYELEVRRADGGSVPVEIMTRFISDSSGRVMFIHGITRDISGRRKAEENLLIREHQLRAILEATEESVLLVDRNERLLEINGVALRRFGLDEQTVRKGLLSDHLHPDVREGRKDNLREVLEKGRPMRFEDEREGRTIMNVYYPVIEKGRVESVAIFGKDITEEKAALKALEESRARLAEANRMLNLVINTIPVRIFWKDSALVFLGCNGLFARDAGESDPSLVTGRDDFSKPWRDQAESYRKDDMEVISSGRARINFEEEQTNSAGESIWLQTSKVPMRDQEGKIFGVLGTYEDVTEKKKLEQAIAESEDRYRSLFHNNHAILYVVDPDTGRIVDANPAACRFYGYDADTFRTMSVTDINIMKPGQIREEMERARSEERYYFIFEHRLANGEIRPVELYGGPIMIKGKKHL